GAPLRPYTTLFRSWGGFPLRRMRRMRRDDFSRRLRREHRVSPDDLIYPVFVIEGRNRTEPVSSMPGVRRVTVDRLLAVAERCLELSIPAFALFPYIAARLQTPDGRGARTQIGLVPHAIHAGKAV